MRSFSTTQAWIVGLALLSLPLGGLIGCGAASEIASPVADDTTQRTVVPSDAVPDTGGPGADPASQADNGPNPAGDMDGNGKVDLADQDAYLLRFDEVFGEGARAIRPMTRCWT